MAIDKIITILINQFTLYVDVFISFTKIRTYGNYRKKTYDEDIVVIVYFKIQVMAIDKIITILISFDFFAQYY